MTVKELMKILYQVDESATVLLIRQGENPLTAGAYICRTIEIEALEEDGAVNRLLVLEYGEV